MFPIDDVIVLILGSSLLEFVILPGQADEFSPLQAASYLHGQLNQDSDIFEEDVMQVSAEITGTVCSEQGSANERRLYFVTTPLIGWAQA